MKTFLPGILLTVVIGALAAYLFGRSGYMPANADARPGKLEIWAASTSLDATIAREAPTIPDPVPPTDVNLREGVALFATNCAVCHGSAKGDEAASPIARGLYQKPPQFASEGVEDDPEADSFWKIQHGIRLTGMPSFGDTLSEQQIWTLATFLKHMDKLPPSVRPAWASVRNWPVTGMGASGAPAAAATAKATPAPAG
ncbi:MAG: cytochrome c [Pseudoxanthomonas sp.]